MIGKASIRWDLIHRTAAIRKQVVSYGSSEANISCSVHRRIHGDIALWRVKNRITGR